MPVITRLDISKIIYVTRGPWALTVTQVRIQNETKTYKTLYILAHQTLEVDQ